MTWQFGDNSGPTVVTGGVYTVAHTFTGSGTIFVQANIQNTLGFTTSNTTFLSVARGVISLPANMTVNETDGAAHIPVSRDNASATTAVSYITSSGSAVAGVRFTQVSGTLSFAVGETTKTIDVPILNTSAFEGDQNFNLITFSPTNGFFLGNSGTTVTIRDDEPPSLAAQKPVISFSSSNYEVSEHDGSATITLLRVGDLSRSSAVSYTDNVCCSGSLIAPASGIIAFQPGESVKTIVIPINDNNMYDGDATFTVSLSNPFNATFPANSFNSVASLKVLDDEPQPSFRINDVRVLEGNTGTTAAVFTISMSAPLRNTMQFILSYKGTATAGTDYQIATTSVAIPAGALSSTFQVPIIGDRDPEPDETIVITATVNNCCAVALPFAAKQVGVCTIVNDDPGFIPASQILAVNARGTLSLTIGPPPGSPQTVVLVNSDPTVLDVPPTLLFTNTGTQAFDIRAKRLGRATVSAVVGGQTFTATVIVNDSQAADVLFTPATLTLFNGQAGSVSASLRPNVAPGGTFPLSGDTSRLQFPPSITFDAGGNAGFMVKALKSGAAAITLTLDPTHGGRTYVLDVDVLDAPAAPAITRVVPNNGPAAGGTPVSIEGANFRADCSLQFGGAPAGNVVLTPTGSLTATTPPHTAGTIDVTLSCGTDTFTLSNAFTFLATTPALTGIFPALGSTAGGSFVRITGRDFRSGCWPFFDGLAGHGATFVSPAEMLVSTPSHAAGSVTIEMRCTGVQAATLSNAFTFTTVADPAPSLTEVSPLFGAPGQSINIGGVRFRPTDAVSFDGVRATVLTSTPDSHRVRIPELPLGMVSINVLDTRGNVSTTGPIFMVVEARPPQIVNISPSAAPPGAELLITGTDFRPAYGIAIGNQPAPLLSMTPTQLSVRVPSLQPGRYAINVVNAAGQVAAIGPQFTVSATGLAVSSATPACATTDGGVEILLHGSGFQSGATATVNGVVTNVVVVDDTTLRLAVPPSDTGPATIEVRNANGERATLTGAFVYLSPFDPDAACGARPRPARH